MTESCATIIVKYYIAVNTAPRASLLQQTLLAIIDQSYRMDKDVPYVRVNLGSSP